jgi:hypothetical protein
MIAIDHVILVAADLEKAAASLFETHGLASLPGGRHPGHGTANRIVPLGDSYLELMGVVDVAEAATSPMGRWALQHRRPDPIPVAMCLRTDDIGPIAAALGETPQAMHRIRTDGVRLSWQLAGVGGMFEQGLPFFIQWELAPGDHPAAGVAPHRIIPTGIAGVVVGPVVGPVARMVAGVPGVTITRGQPGVRWVDVATTTGTVRLGA